MSQKMSMWRNNLQLKCQKNQEFEQKNHFQKYCNFFLPRPEGSALIVHEHSLPLR